MMHGQQNVKNQVLMVQQIGYKSIRMQHNQL